MQQQADHDEHVRNADERIDERHDRQRRRVRPSTNRHVAGPCSHGERQLRLRRAEKRRIVRLRQRNPGQASRVVIEVVEPGVVRIRVAEQHGHRHDHERIDDAFEGRKPERDRDAPEQNDRHHRQDDVGDQVDVAAGDARVVEPHHQVFGRVAQGFRHPRAVVGEIGRLVERVRVEQIAAGRRELPQRKQIRQHDKRAEQHEPQAALRSRHGGRRHQAGVARTSRCHPSSRSRRSISRSLTFAHSGDFRYSYRL